MSGKLSMRRLRYDDKDTNDLAEAVSGLVMQLNASAILGGRLLEGVDLRSVAPEQNSVRHGLGARPKGAFVVQQSAPADIQVISSPGAEALTLTTTAVVTVSLWVF